MSTIVQLLKSVGAIPQSEEYRVGDEVVTLPTKRPAVVVATVGNGDSFKVKVAYKDKDEIGFLSPTDVRHA